MERYTSASAMPSKVNHLQTVNVRWVYITGPWLSLRLLLIILFFLPIPPFPHSPIYPSSSIAASAEVIDRVAAFIDDEVITLSEFQEYYRNTVIITPGISERDAMETLINRRLLLREANRLRLRGQSEDELIDKYIDIRVRAFTRVSSGEISAYYSENIERLDNTSLKDVEREIERLLLERKVNTELRSRLEELRKMSYIKINIRFP